MMNHAPTVELYKNVRDANGDIVTDGKPLINVVCASFPQTVIVPLFDFIEWIVYVRPFTNALTSSGKLIVTAPKGSVIEAGTLTEIILSFPPFMPDVDVIVYVPAVVIVLTDSTTPEFNFTSSISINVGVVNVREANAAIYNINTYIFILY